MRESPRPILLDISRTVARSRLPRPTGIDRVERAYINWAMQRDAHFLAAVDDRHFLLNVASIRPLLDWLDGKGVQPRLDLLAWLKPQRDIKLRAAQAHIRRNAIASTRMTGLVGMLRRYLPHGDLYLNVGHDNLSDGVIDALGSAGLARAVMIHDTIPLDYPEFAQDGTPARFLRKMNAVRRADHLIANSQHTAERLRAHGANQSVTVAPLGIEPLPRRGPNAPEQPTFVTLGTIEPRKNHALLLSVWQRLWDEMGAASPKLVILGRRGWKNDAVFRTLDSAPMMGRTVIEAGTLDDTALSEVLSRATALLFPSHAEGYGLPLAEALDAGVPCITSNLPALREVGGVVPEYLSPTDEAAWHQAVLEYANPDHPRRTEQLARLPAWQCPTWAAHFDAVENAMETILVQSERRG